MRTIMTSLVKPDSNYSIGKVVSGLILHPDNEHIIYPLGTTIVVRHIISRTQQFLRVCIILTPQLLIYETQSSKLPPLKRRGVVSIDKSFIFACLTD
jgi:hypothetical protein